MISPPVSIASFLVHNQLVLAGKTPPERACSGSEPNRDSCGLAVGTLLCCTAVQTRLPSAALQLLNDLVQLLFYYSGHSIDDPVSDHAEDTITCMQVDKSNPAILDGYLPTKIFSKGLPPLHSWLRLM